MAIKLLENKGIENTGIGASALNNLITGNKSGIVGNYLNECVFTATGNTIIIDKGLLIICGRQVEIDAIESITLSSLPSEDVRYQIVIELTREESGEVTASIFARQPSTLIQENLMKDGFVYQFELGRVTHTTSGKLEDIIRTADILTSGSIGGADFEIGEVTTETLSEGLDAEVDIEKRQVDNKQYIDFNFSIPAGKDGSVDDQYNVKVVEQAFSEPQKAQARANIDTYGTSETDNKTFARVYNTIEEVVPAVPPATRSNPTPQEFANTMESNSVAVIGASNGSSFYPALLPSDAAGVQGVLRVEKADNNAVSFTYTNKPNTDGGQVWKWTGFCRPSANRWSGWHRENGVFPYGTYPLISTNTSLNYNKFMEISCPDSIIVINFAGFVQRNAQPNADYSNKILFTFRRYNGGATLSISGETSVTPITGFGTFFAIMDETNRKISVYYKPSGSFSGAAITWCSFASFTAINESYNMVMEDTGSADPPAVPEGGASATLEYTGYTQLANKTMPLLWSGSFNSGSITVPGISNYKIIVVGVGTIPFTAIRTAVGTRFLGGGNYDGGEMTTFAIDMSVNGDTVTYGSCYSIAHNPVATHGSKGTGVAITEIRGVI